MKPTDEKIAALIDAALEPDAHAERIEEATPEEAAELATLERILSAVDTLPRPEPSPGLRTGLLERMNAEDARREQTLWARVKRASEQGWWTPAGGLGLAGAAGGLGLAGAAAAVVLLTPGTQPDLPRTALAQAERLEVAENLELYQNLELVEDLELLEELELIESLPEERG